MKRKLFVLFFILISIILIGATYTSILNGDWSNSATWGTSAPSYSTADNITIASTVTTTANIVIKAGGYLTILSNDTLIVNDMTFSNGSYISIYGVLIVNGNLDNKNNSVNVVINGVVDVSGDFYNGNGGIVTGNGSISTDGSYTGTGITFGYTNEEIPAGSTVSSGSLPVELLYFVSNIADNGDIILRWSTASETNNDYFTVEFSNNGQNFEEVAKVLGAGNSNEILVYTYKVENLDRLYYRLKQTDYDGNYAYSDIIYVEKSPILNKTVNVYSITGQLVYSGYDLKTYDLPSGIYIIITDKDSSRKIYVQ